MNFQKITDLAKKVRVVYNDYDEIYYAQEGSIFFIVKVIGNQIETNEMHCNSITDALLDDDLSCLDTYDLNEVGDFTNLF